MSLPNGEKQREFSELSNQEKANVFRVHLALNFVKRPNLTKEQKQLILEAISIVSSEIYNKENSELKVAVEKQNQDLQNKAFSIFPANEVHDIFATMNGDKSKEIAILRKYENILSLPIRERKKTVRELSPTEKNVFWKSQLIYYLATSDLSLTQKLFITEVISLMTDNSLNFPIVDGQPKNSETIAIETFISKGVEIFTREEFFTLFMGYGIHRTTTNKAVVANNDLLRACDCNYLCGIGESCTATSCAVSKNGCGILGGSECHSYCMED